MGNEEVEGLIAAGRELYLRLHEEATELLRNLDTHSPEKMVEAVKRRQNLVEALQSFDMRSRAASVRMDDPGLVEFREFQEEITRKILEIDGLVIALEREKQAVLKDKLASLSKSVVAVHAYEKSGRRVQRRPWLNDSA